MKLRLFELAFSTGRYQLLFSRLKHISSLDLGARIRPHNLPHFSIISSENVKTVAETVSAMAPQSIRKFVLVLNLGPGVVHSVEAVQVVQVPNPIMPAKQVQIVLTRHHSMGVSGNRGSPLQLLELEPANSLDIEDLHLIKTADAVKPSEHVQLLLDPVQGVAGPGRRLVPRNVDFDPIGLGGVENEEVVKPLVPVVPSVHVDFVAVGGCSMVVPGDWQGPGGEDFGPCTGLEVHREDVVKGAEAVPPSEYV